MRYEFYYYETCGGLVKLTAEDSQKVKAYMDEHSLRIRHDHKYKKNVRDLMLHLLSELSENSSF